MIRKLSAGDLIRFGSGEIGMIVDVFLDAGSGQSVGSVWMSGEVTFRNPTIMDLEDLKRNVEVIK